MKYKIYTLILFTFIFLIFSYPTKAKEYESNPLINNSFTYSPWQNEILTLATLKKLYLVQLQYKNTVGKGNFGLAQDLYEAGLIDEYLSVYRKFGYDYVYSLQSTDENETLPPSFLIKVVPFPYIKAGKKSMEINSLCEIRVADKRGNGTNVDDPITEVCPRLIQSEYEERVIVALDELFNAQQVYFNGTGNGNYAENLMILRKAGLISENLSDGFFSYYRIELTAEKTANQSFEVKARPTVYRRSGFRSFYLDETGILRGADRKGVDADENDPPIKR